MAQKTTTAPMKDGFKRLQFPEGGYYEGEFKSGTPHGRGKSVDPLVLKTLPLLSNNIIIINRIAGKHV